MVYFQHHYAVVVFQFSPVVSASSEFHGGINARQLVDVFIVSSAVRIRVKEHGAQSCDVFLFGFCFYPVYPCVSFAGAEGFFSTLPVFSDKSYFHPYMCFEIIEQ